MAIQNHRKNEKQDQQQRLDRELRLKPDQNLELNPGQRSGQRSGQKPAQNPDKNLHSPGHRLTRGALAKAAGVKAETVRYYENIGLMPPPERSAKGYRLYGQSQQQRLIFIRRAKELGFDATKTRALLAMIDGEADCGEAQAMAQINIAAIDEKIADLGKMRAALTAMAAACTGTNSPVCPIIERLMES